MLKMQQNVLTCAVRASKGLNEEGKSDRIKKALVRQTRFQALKPKLRLMLKSEAV